MQLNPIAANSSYITADHLQELAYPHDKLDSYAKIINAHIDACRSQSSTQIRVRKQARSTPFTFNLEHPNTTAMRVTIIFPRSMRMAGLGIGEHKKIKKAIAITLDFQDIPVKIQIEKIALYRFKKTLNCSDAKSIMQWHQAVANSLPDETSLATVPHTRLYTNKQAKERIELESARYDGDLYKLKAYDKITPSQSMLLLSQIADTLQAMHDAGFVHKDVKPDNILVSMGPDGVKKQCLNDFDHTGEIEYKVDNTAYESRYWDACATAGIALPNVDIYGLTTCAFEALIPESAFLSKLMTPLVDKGQQEALFQKLLPKCSRTAKTIPELIESLGNYIKEQDKQKLARAQARIILIMAREVKNSQELFDYYQRKRHLFSDIHLFLESASIAIPSLSTARLLASELREIHQSLMT